jgi:hypothetical protein
MLKKLLRYYKPRVKKVLKKIFRIFAFLLAGFAGGALTPWTLGWIKGIEAPSASDAVSIANTYIVFTTIIFVGVTVILAVAGYVFTQQFSATKGAQESEALNELKEKIKNDESIGIALANSILENSDVKRHLESLLKNKFQELIEAQLSDAKEDAQQKEARAVMAKDQVSAIQTLRSQLNGKGDKNDN